MSVDTAVDTIMKTELLAPFLISHPRMDFGDKKRCTYCGLEDPTLTDLAIPPRSFLPASVFTNRKGIEKLSPQTPACLSCSRSLIGKSHPTFDARAEFLATQLQCFGRKTERQWMQHDFNREKGWFQDSRKSLLRKLSREEIEARMNWYLSSAYCENLSGLLEKPELNPTLDSFNLEYYQFFESTLKAIQVQKAVDMALGSE